MPVYVRVRDDATGHEYDVDQRSIRDGMTEVDGYPPNSGPGARPRPPKHRVAKDGRTATRRTTKPPAASAPTDQPEGVTL